MLDVEIWNEVPVKLSGSIQWSEKEISWKQPHWNCDLSWQKDQIWDNPLSAVEICFMGHLILFSSKDDSPSVITGKVRELECYVLKQTTTWIDLWCNLIFSIHKSWIWRKRNQLLPSCNLCLTSDCLIGNFLLLWRNLRAFFQEICWGVSNQT